MSHWSDGIVKQYSPCLAAVEWIQTQKSPAIAWKNCKRGDWMLWLAGRMSGKPETASRKRLVLAACACARLSLKYVKKGENRPRVAIETAEAWAKGKEGVTLEKVKSASYASAAAYAYAASSAASSAAYAAYADAYDAADAAADSARTKTLSACADIVRRFYPKAPTTKEGK